MKQYLNRSFYIKSDTQVESDRKSNRQKSLQSKINYQKIPPLINQTIQSQEYNQQIQPRIQLSRQSISRFSKTKYLKQQKINQSISNITQDNQQQQQIAQQSLEQFFLSQGFDFAQSIQRNNYLPIERFDDDQFQTLSNEQVIQMLKVQKQIHIQVMEQSSMGDWFWYDGLLIGYSKLFHYQRKNREGRCARIHFILDCENRKLYMKKLQRAIYLRDQMDRYLKFNCYIENMPTSDLVQISNQQMKRIKNRIGQIFQKQWISRELMEVNKLFLKTQNEIIFIHFLKNNQINQKLEDLLQLFIEEQQKQQKIQFNNLIQVQNIYTNGLLFQSIQTSFSVLRQAYYLSAIGQNKQIQKALESINNSIDQLYKLDIFQYQQQFFEKFKNSQEQYIRNVFSNLQNNWIQEIIENCEQNLQIQNKKSQTLNQIQLDKFFQLTRLKLQDSLYFFIKQSIQKYMWYLQLHIPETIIIHSISDVQNVYVHSESLTKSLFTLKIILQGNEIEYLINPGLFESYMKSFFNIIYQEIIDIPDPETRLVEYFHKEFLYQMNGNLKGPTKNEQFQQLADTQIEQINDKIKKSTQEFLNQFQYIEQIIKHQQFSISQAQELIFQNRKNINQINKIPDCTQVGIFQIILSDLRESILQILYQRESNYIQQLTQYTQESTMKLLNQYAKLELKVIEKPNNIQQLVEKREFLEQYFPQQLQQLSDEANQIKYYFELLNSVLECDHYVQIKFYPLRREETYKYYQMLLKEKQLLNLAQINIQQLEQQKQEIYELQTRDQKKFSKKLQNLNILINQFKQLSSIDQNIDAQEQLKTIEESLQFYSIDALNFNKREQLFGLEQTNYDILLQLQVEFQPYKIVWQGLQIWQTQSQNWLNDSLQNVDYKSCEQFFNVNYKLLSQIEDKLISTSIYNIWKILKIDTDQLQIYIPILLALTKNNLRQRHYEQLCQLLSITDQSIKNNLTLNHLIKLNIQNYLTECLMLGQQAQEEYGIEQMLLQLQNIWDTQKFQITQIKGIYIFLNLEQIQQQVDDHLIQLEQMIKQRNNTYFIDQINQLYEQLKQLSSFLDQWNKAQIQIIYLQPIFDSVDILKQLPVEYRKYRQVDKQYQELQSITNKIIEFGQQDIKKIQQINLLLDQIHKELGNYLERKKETFSRLYFISNEEILEILSNGQEIEQIQKHIYKLFDGVIRLKLNKKQEIIGIQSKDTEMILQQKIITIGKNIEEWLKDLEIQIKISVQQGIINNNYEYGNQFKMINFEIDHSQRIDNDLKNGRDLRIYLCELKERLQIQNQDNLLIILLAHHIQMLQQIINQQSIQFYWNLQLRYYLNNNNQCIINSFQSSINYGNEYQGNISRIIITPLTDRCFIIFLNAIHYQKGGAAIGGTGTGKTETIKDLCKAMGQKCIIFNCSELVDYVLISQLIKGFKLSECWSCFDEFNRITIEVLSVAASQLFYYQPQGIFVSMNPKYQGRSQLPDNLKQYFRLASMIIPDMQIIISTMFSIYNFQESQQLTKKLIYLIEITEGLLSKQYHYDYSLRAIKSVVDLAGQLKIEFSQLNEQQILLKSLRYVFEPKLQEDDKKILNQLIQQFFNEEIENENMIQEYFQYVPTQILQQKCNEFKQILKIRNGIMIVGPAGQGKSTLIDIIIKQNQFTFAKIFPKAVKVQELFGCLNLNSLQWEEGILSSLLKQEQNFNCLIFDGEVETTWIETLNSALDESRKLCLTNGSIINITSKLIFEVDTLQGATPSTISRCSVIYIQDSPLLGLNKYLEIQFPNQYQNFLNIIDKCLNRINIYNIKLNHFQTQMINIIEVIKKEYNQFTQQLFIYCLSWCIIPFIQEKNEKIKMNSFLKSIGNIQCEDLLIYNEYKEDKKRFNLIYIPTLIKYTSFEDIYVPKIDQLSYLKISLLLLKEKSIRFVGQSGSGKTQIANQILMNFQYVKINCSSSSCSSGIQLTLEQNLDKRRKGVFGPQIGQKCIIMLDDFHMPQDVELIRQLLNQKGWYNKKELLISLQKVEDTTILVAMTNQYKHNDRLTRLFTTLQLENDDNVEQSIFVKMTQMYQLQHIVPQIFTIYRKIKEQLKPTPNKIHYQFSLRDIWRVCQSMCINKTQNQNQLQFECSRVFNDRLITKQDKMIAQSIIGLENVYFSNFSSGQNDHTYREIKNIEQLLNLMKEKFIKFQIPIYEDALKLLISISRVLGLQQGHLTILGQVGTGGIALSKLASFILDYEYPLIERWKDDLKCLIKKCINENKKISIIIDEYKYNMNQILIFEDLSTMLNQGDLDLFNRQELDELYQIFLDEAKSLLQEQNQNIKILLHKFYIEKLKKNIHFIVQLNSQNKFRQFPNLMTCTTIITLQQLPEQALLSIAKTYLININNVKISNQLCDIFKYFHQTSQLIDNHQKIITVSSIHYQILIETFNFLYSNKSNKLNTKIIKIQNGLKQLLSANETIQELKDDLLKITPKIEKAQQESAQMMQKLKEEKEQASLKESLLSDDEQQANIQQIQATKLANEASLAVKEVNLILDQTLQDVSKLKKEHLVEIKSLGKPPKPVIIILTGVVILNLDNLKNVITQPIQQLSNQDYFEIAKKYLLNDPKELLELIRNYDKNNINPYNINRLEKIVLSEIDFTFERAKQCSAAVKYLYSWVKAMYDYNKVYIETKPLREKLQEAQQQLQDKTNILNEKKIQLQIIFEKVQQLQEQYDQQILKCEQLNQQLQISTNKLQRAQYLTQGLEEEQKRWSQQIQQLKMEQNVLVGDCSIASAYLNYCSSLSELLRIQLIQSWIKYVKPKIGFETLPQLFLNNNIIVDAAQNNHIFLQYTNKPILCIDPQCLANQYIRKDDKIVLITNQNQFDLAIQLKQSILIEIINEIPEWLLSYIQNNDNSNNKLNIYVTTMQFNFQLTSLNYSQFYIVNYQITKSNAEELIIDQIVNIYSPELYQQQINVKQMEIENINKLNQIEENILSILNVENLSDLLNEEKLIHQLYNSKSIFKEIQQSQKDFIDIQTDLIQAKQQYKKLAYKITELYFITQDIQYFNSMYQFSLEWFLQILRQTIENLQDLKQIFTQFRVRIFCIICRVLKQNEKLILAFLLAKQTLIDIDQQEWQAFIGFKSNIEEQENNLEQQQQQINIYNWIDNKNYKRIQNELKNLNLMTSKILSNNFDQIEQFYTSKKFILQQIPHQDKLNDIQKIFITKAIRPDYVTNIIKWFINKQLDFEFEKIESISIEQSFDESEKHKILLYVLQNNSDPIQQIQEFAISKKFNKKLLILSLGQGQGQKAEKMLLEAIEQGLWLVIQNCHLHQQWLSELNKLVMNESHNEYRLWLTSKSITTFPNRILQNSVKITYNSTDDISITNNLIQKFHQTILNHCKLGIQGFNQQYEFTNYDLQITQQQYKEILLQEEQKNHTLFYIITQLHYGGHITDQHDQIILNKITTYQITDQINIPINNLAEIYFEETATKELLNILLLKEQGEINSQNINYIKTINILKNNLPNQIQYDINKIFKLSKFIYQEITKINNLLAIISNSIIDLERIIAGESLIDISLLDDIKYLRVPYNWQIYGFKTDNNLSKWYQELLERYKQLQNWSQNGEQNAIWLGGFFNPKGFLMFSKYESETLNQKTIFTVLDNIILEHITIPPEKGFYIYGITISGAKWETNQHILIESDRMLNEFPICYLHYREEEEYQLFYNCPIYQLLDRQDLITNIQLPCDPNIDWIIRGIAAFSNYQI